MDAAEASSQGQATTPAGPRTAADSADDLEALVRRLRVSYSVALAFARDLPWLGRCSVEIERRNERRRRRRRWVARLPTGLYVELHIRGQLEHLVACLQDEMLDPAKEEPLGALALSLEERVARLASWRHLKGFVLRLPPVAATLPLLGAAFAAPVIEVGWRELGEALVGVLVAAAVVYALVIWPSIKLGFRVKRAIFSGGVDFAYPWAYEPGIATWRAAPLQRGAVTGDFLVAFRRWLSQVRHRRSSGSTSKGTVELGRPFPPIDVYRDEDLLFGRLGRRKREEAPLDLVLSVNPYLKALLSLLFVTGYVGFLVSGDLRDDLSRLLYAPLVPLVALVPVQLFWQLRANHRRRTQRPHTSEAAGASPVDGPATPV